MTACSVRDLEALIALDLDEEREREVRRHVAGCVACADELAALDPALALALRAGEIPGPEDEDFVAAVMAGVRERDLEGELAPRAPRRSWLAAAALIASVGLVTWMAGGFSQQRETQSATAVEAPAPFVEVEGEGVRVYELTSSSDATVRVAFIVDPSLEI